MAAGCNGIPLVPSACPIWLIFQPEFLYRWIPLWNADGDGEPCYARVLNSNCKVPFCTNSSNRNKTCIAAHSWSDCRAEMQWIIASLIWRWRIIHGKLLSQHAMLTSYYYLEWQHCVFIFFLWICNSKLCRIYANNYYYCSLWFSIIWNLVNIIWIRFSDDFRFTTVLFHIFRWWQCYPCNGWKIAIFGFPKSIYI